MELQYELVITAEHIYSKVLTTNKIDEYTLKLTKQQLAELVFKATILYNKKD